jgi:tetratricopeptide (TPR) repeat protein
LRTARFHFAYVIANSRIEQPADALYYRGYIEYDQGDLDSARSDVYKLQDDFSAYEFWVVKGFILLGDIYVKKKDYFQAKATLQSILDNYDKEGDGLLDICRMKLKQLEKRGNTDDVAPLEEE